MIRVERRDTDESRAAIASLEDAKKHKGNCNTPEVVQALRSTFHGKCYICEDKSSTSLEVEHFVPHRGNSALKYSWDNLFWACRHCNGIKAADERPLLDCTKEDVDEAISFVKEGYFGTDERLVFKPLDEREETANTVDLLERVYYGTTAQKQVEARILRKKVREELTTFKAYVRAYHEETDQQEKTYLGALLWREMSAGSPFVAFKRWLVRNNKNYYSDAYEVLENVMER